MIFINRLLCTQGKNCNVLPRIYLSSVTKFSEFSNLDNQSNEKNEKQEKRGKPKSKLYKDTLSNDVQHEDTLYSFREKQTFSDSPEINDVPKRFWQPNDASSIIKNADPSDILKVLKHYSNKNIRPLQFLKLLSNRIFYNEVQLDLQQASTLLYFLAVFSYKDVDLIDTLAENLLAEGFPDKTGSLSISVMHSIGKLKYRNCDLIDTLGRNILKLEDDTKKIKGMLTALLTMAVVNAESPYLSTFYTKLSECSKENFSSSKSLLDFVWASVLLNKLSVENISSVLCEDYINQLLVFDGATGRSSPTQLKLQNINIAATTLLPSYDGPKLPKKLCNSPQLSTSKTRFLHAVLDPLSNLFSKNGLFQTNVNFGGFLVEIQFYMDSKGHCVNSNTEGATKTAIMLLEYNDLCTGSNEIMTGINNFKHRILKASGFNVITIPHTEFQKNISLNDKIDYLQKKLKNVKN